MPKYTFLLFDDEAWYDTATDESIAEEMDLHGAFEAAVTAAGGKVLGGEALERSSTATVVRREPEASPTVTDGPFIETKEALGGFYVIEAPDLDVALELAKVCPSRSIEVRPVMEFGD